MASLFGLLLFMVGVIAALTFFIWYIDRIFPSKESMIEKAIREADEKAELERRAHMKFALWGVCNQIEVQRALEEQRKNETLRPRDTDNDGS